MNMAINKKILIFGAGGLLGTELADYSKRNNNQSFEIIPLLRDVCDITEQKDVTRALHTHKPDIIINCAVLISVDECEKNPILAEDINVGGVRNILESIKIEKTPLTFVQISSSEVFGRVKDGEYKIGGYKEDDEPQPISVYQRTKAEAERVVQDFAKMQSSLFNHWYIVRAGWLYGARRPTFIEQFLEKLQKDNTLDIIANQWRSPTWTRHFADGLFNILAKEGTYESSIYHIINETYTGEASTLDVVEELVNFLGVRKIRASLRLVHRDDIFKVPRAPSNVLINTKLPKLPLWRDALREYLYVGIFAQRLQTVQSNRI
jgi:dTDP-4-dehydrorhamnose reductase